ncbi:unnamed protein product [Ceratitis capitata]|uniref:(Mediterranean fruit fly) hypothetical protein n=1 Tax=Ceratitis capitata TaxID=7213 RepID=W8CBR4_CERCA|nr:unnamed protein product [Ceratitis capitata]
MQVISTTCSSLIFVCFLLNFGHMIKATPLLSTPDGSTPAVSGTVTEQQKSMTSLLNADKLDLTAAAVAEDSAGADYEKRAAANGERVGNRQARQILYPYVSAYGHYYGGYPYYYPYSSYTSRPYYYYKPVYSYGFPFYLYG